MPNKLTDWEVELGFNTSKVDAGLKKLEGRFKNLNLGNEKDKTKARSKRMETLHSRAIIHENAQAKAAERKKETLHSRAIIEGNARAAKAARVSRIVAGTDPRKKMETLHSRGIIEGNIRAARELTRSRRDMVKMETLHSRAIIENNRLTTTGLKKQNTLVTSITRSFKNMTLAVVSAYAIIGGGKALIEASKRLDSLRASMLAASGDAKAAKADFEFVRQSSKNLGTSLFVAASGFQKIGTSMRAAGFDDAGIKNVFLAASEASIAFGLSADDTAGVMKAFSQISSKGTVSAEELRQQLGDRLPGAFQMAARAMGVTTTELDKMLQSGSLASDVFLPKFADELRKTVRETGALGAGMRTIRAEQARLGTAGTEFAEGLLDAGGKGGLKDVLNLITTFVQALKPVGAAVMRVVRPIVSVIAGIAKLIILIVKPIATVVDNILSLLGPSKETMEVMEKWASAILSGNSALDGTNDKLSTTLRWLFGIKAAWHGILGLAYKLNEVIEDSKVISSTAAGFITGGPVGAVQGLIGSFAKTKQETDVKVDVTITAETGAEAAQQFGDSLQEILNAVGPR